jgi:hypothetical protein
MKILFLGGCTVDTDAAVWFGLCLRRLPSLTVIDLAEQRDLFSSRGLIGLCAGLGKAGHFSVRELRVPFYCVDSQAAGALGCLLSRFRKLEIVDLEASGEVFTVDGIAAFASGFDRMHLAMRSLVLYDCDITEDAAVGFRRVLELLPALQSLDLNNVSAALAGLLREERFVEPVGGVRSAGTWVRRLV